MLNILKNYTIYIDIYDNGSYYTLYDVLYLGFHGSDTLFQYSTIQSSLTTTNIDKSSLVLKFIISFNPTNTLHNEIFDMIFTNDNRKHNSYMLDSHGNKYEFNVSFANINIEGKAIDDTKMSFELHVNTDVNVVYSTTADEIDLSYTISDNSIVINFNNDLSAYHIIVDDYFDDYLGDVPSSFNDKQYCHGAIRDYSPEITLNYGNYYSTLNKLIIIASYKASFYRRCYRYKILNIT